MTLELIAPWVAIFAAQIVFVIGLINAMRTKIRTAEIEHFDYWFGKRSMELVKEVHKLAIAYKNLHPNEEAYRLSPESVHQLEALIEESQAEYYRVVAVKRMALPDILINRFEEVKTQFCVTTIKDLSENISDGISIEQESPAQILVYCRELEGQVREFTKIIRKRLVASKGMFICYFFQRKDLSLQAIEIDGS